VCPFPRINAVSSGQVTGDTYTEGCLGRRGARAWLFVGFVLAFAGLIGSLWVFIQEFLVPGKLSPVVQPGLNDKVLRGLFLQWGLGYVAMQALVLKPSYVYFHMAV